MEPSLETPQSDKPAAPASQLSSKRLPLIIAAVVLLSAAGGAGVFALISNKKEDPSIANDQRIRADEDRAREEARRQQEEANGGQQSMGNAKSSDAEEKGRALANGTCEGTGSKPLTSAPMHPSDLSVIIPYGLMAGGHVTPIDHQYYWGKQQFGNPDMYDVLAPADGRIVGVQYRNRSQEGGKVKGDYRVVISYSCTFFSYFDLATSLSPDIQAALPAGWEQNPNQQPHIDFPVKAGQVVGKVGGQSLDFAVWDTTKSLKNLLVPAAYNNAEPWKIATVPPLDYYSQNVKDEILPLYARTAEPRDGVIDQDVDGSAMGTWFKEGTNGYAGSATFTGGTYWGGHLSFAKDHVDPEGGYVFSTGDWKGSATQFAIINPTVKPEQLTVASGQIKYQLGSWNHTLNGRGWVGEGPGAIKFVAGPAQGTVMVQLLESHKLKVEVFPGKTPSQVNSFTDAALLYNRGDDAQ